MTASGSVFVTPHAVKRYTERVEECEYSHAMREILADIEMSTSVSRRSDGVVVVTGRRPRRVRYVIAPPLPGHTLPAVVTVVVR